MGSVAYSVHPQIVTYRATARSKAVDPWACITSRGSLWQAEPGAGSSPLTVCAHSGQACTQHLGCDTGCELLLKRFHGGNCLQLGKSLLLQQGTMIQIDRKAYSGEVGKWYKPGERVSEGKALEPYLYKELVLSPENPVRHRPWTPLSSVVIKKWRTSGLDDTILSSLFLDCVFLLQAIKLHLNTN